LLILGLLGPAVGGMSFTRLTVSRECRRDYWWRIVDPKRIRARWYLVICFFAPALIGVALLADIGLGEKLALEPIENMVGSLLSSPLAIGSFALGTLVYGPLPEELGWRGYALGRLQERYNALSSSLILGTIWALWHLPLFYVRGTTHYSHGAWSAWWWLFLAQTIAVAVIFTWIFNNTRRSTLGAILFHLVVNAAYVVAGLTPRANACAALLWFIAAAAVVAYWGADTLTLGAVDRSGRRTRPKDE
jgi:membrane protease YdiL (CAAX protease family)